SLSQSFQQTGRSARRLFDTVPLVDPSSLSQTVGAPSRGHELPESGSSDVRQRTHSPSTFDLAEPGKILRHAFLPKGLARHFHKATRSTETGLHVAPTAALVIIDELLNQRIDRELEIQSVLRFFERGDILIGDFLFVVRQNQFTQRIKW